MASWIILTEHDEDYWMISSIFHAFLTLLYRVDVMIHGNKKENWAWSHNNSSCNTCFLSHPLTSAINPPCPIPYFLHITLFHYPSSITWYLALNCQFVTSNTLLIESKKLNATIMFKCLLLLPPLLPPFSHLIFAGGHNLWHNEPSLNLIVNYTSCKVERTSPMFFCTMQCTMQSTMQSTMGCSTMPENKRWFQPNRV